MLSVHVLDVTACRAARSRRNANRRQPALKLRPASLALVFLLAGLPGLPGLVPLPLAGEAAPAVAGEAAAAVSVEGAGTAGQGRPGELSGNLLANPGFDGSDVTALDGWEFSTWVKEAGRGQASLDTKVFNTGPSSLRIDNRQADDAKLVQRVAVEPDSWYRAWVWVKTLDVPDGKSGANISAMDITATSLQLKGTADWTRLEVYGQTGPDQQELELTLRLGGYGSTTTGTAWFDDAGFQKMSGPPAGRKTIKWFRESGAGETLAKFWTSPGAAPILYGLLWGWLAGFGLVLWMLRNGAGQPEASLDPLVWERRLLVVLGWALAIKLAIGGAILGYNSDMGTFGAWSKDVFALGPGDFYRQGTFADYPPGYMWFLWLVGAAKALFQVPDWSFVHLLLLKLPAVVADLVTVWLVWRLALRRWDVARVPAAADSTAGVAGPVRPLAWALALALLVLPLTTMDSSVWGQVDSIFTLALVLALVFLEDRRLVLAAGVYALAVLLKPQALLLAPLALVALGREFRLASPGAALRRIGLSLLAFAGVALVVVLPFGFKQKPGWIFELYGGTLGSYPYVSLNAPNLWTLLGLNWVPLETPVLGMPAGSLAWGLMLAALVLVFVLACTGRRPGTLVLGGFLITLAFFVLGPKMHERYIYPAVILGLLAWVFIRDRRLLAMSLLLGANATINLFMVLVYKNNFNTSLVPVWDPVLIAGSALNLGILVWAFKAGIDLLLRHRPPRDFDWQSLLPAVPASPAARKPRKAGPTLSQAAAVPEVPEVPELVRAADGAFRIRRADWLAMAAITGIFALASFLNLGSTVSPQKAWLPLRSGETVVFDFGSLATVDKAGYHWGLGTGEFRLDWSADGENWTPGPRFGNENRFVEMRWYYQEVQVTARYGRITVLSGRQELDEMAFWSGRNLLLPRLVSGSPAVFDEPETATLVSDYYNGMYFDEVYHARAAWEYLHGRDSSENTHPPLGKLIIALGIKIFGMNAFGWRFMGALFGVLMLPVFYLMALRLFRNSRWAAVACGLFALDFMHFAQTRISTIDTYGVFFILLSYLFMLGFLQGNILRDPWWKTSRQLLGSGLAFGLGAASKWIVLYAAVGLLIFWLVRVVGDLRQVASDLPGRLKMRALGVVVAVSVVCFLILPALIYTASYIPMMQVSRNGLQAMLDNQSSMYNYHAKLEATHPFSSYWYQWPVMTRPIYYYSGGDVVPKDQISSIYAFGNPAVWWTGSLAFLWLLFLSVRRLAGRWTAWRQSRRGGGDGRNQGRATRAPAPAGGKGRGPAARKGKSGARVTEPAKAMAAGRTATAAGAEVAGPALAGDWPGATATWGLPAWGVFFILCGGLIQYLPWAIIPRQLVFIYHFFASVPFIVLALTWVLRALAARGGWRQTVVLLVLAGLLAVYFYPILSGAPVSRAWFAPLSTLTGLSNGTMGWPW